jgi:hypothetical protein
VVDRLSVRAAGEDTAKILPGGLLNESLLRSRSQSGVPLGQISVSQSNSRRVPRTTE